jgi:hypothetical protein
VAQHPTEFRIIKNYQENDNTGSSPVLPSSQSCAETDAC